jgi:hypothetical protein
LCDVQIFYDEASSQEIGEMRNLSILVRKSPGKRLLERPKQSLLAACFMLDSYLAYYSTLKMKAVCSSETSIDFQRTTWRYIPEDRLLLTINLFKFQTDLCKVSEILAIVNEFGRHRLKYSN